MEIFNILGTFFLSVWDDQVSLFGLRTHVLNEKFSGILQFLQSRAIVEGGRCPFSHFLVLGLLPVTSIENITVKQ
jgi:hypothetical protein